MNRYLFSLLSGKIPTVYHKILKRLIDGQKYTLQQLIEQLTISPRDLEQALNTLTRYGVKLHSPTSQTYQWVEPLELLDYSYILTALPSETRQRLAHLEILDVVDSTSRYLLAMRHRALPLVCLAEYQTAGRGQQGRQWVSPYASGICLSIKYRYRTLKESLAGLNLALAVTVVRVLNTLGATQIGLKWPNDILWQGRKLAGLLLESRYGKEYEIVIGLGINVKMPSVDTMTIDQPWVDLYTVLGKRISRNKLAALLIDQCLQTLIRYPQVGLAAFWADWHRFDLSYGQTVTLKIAHHNSQTTVVSPLKQDTLLTGTALGIDKEGALLLQVGNQKQRYAYGEVRLQL